MLLLSTIRGCWRRIMRRTRMKGFKSIPRVCAFLSALFVGVYVYIFSVSGGKGVMEPFKYPQYPNATYQLTQWPFLGVNPLLMETRKETECELPKLEIFNSHVLPFYHPRGPMDCVKLFNKKMGNNKYLKVVAFTVKNGRDLHQLVNMTFSCCYQPFATVDPGEGLIKPMGSCNAIRNNVTVIPNGIHYIQVLCKDTKHQILYYDGFPLVHPQPMRKSGSEINNQRLNIIVIGLDTTSRLNFLRFMPLSRNYLLSPEMSAIALHGYSVVARGTQSNVLPMLSGLSRYDLEQRCYFRNGNWNNCSKLIWEQASNRGYVTNYAEDWQVFQYYYNHSFAKPPTDYHFWPFAVKMRTFGNKSVSRSFFCVGTRLTIQVLLNFAQSVCEVAQKQNRPHFQFLWSTALSHSSSLNSLSLGDAHLVGALKKFKEIGVVNNTVIMILGDHGNGQSDYFRTPSGRIEYRLPVAHIVLPPWFKTKFPREHNNLVRNSRVRTTSYDIYETMMDIMDLGLPQQKDTSSRREKGFGISLFERIPENRYCTESGIRLELCNMCHPKIQLSTSDPLVKSAAEIVVEKINSLTENRTHPLCQNLGLFKVLTAELWHPKDVVMELCNTTGSVPCTSFDNVNEKENVNRVAIISLMLTTTPNAIFLAGDVRLIWTKNISVNRKPDIVETTSGFDVAMRVGRYAETGRCAKRELQPFCICNIPFFKAILHYIRNLF